MNALPPSTRVVLLTGAAGGLGQGLVSEFVSQGWLVAAAHHRATPHQETDFLWPVQMDVTCRAGVEQTVRQLLSRWGRVDVLINNAGIIADQLAWQIDDEAWEKVLAVNLKGAFICSQMVIRSMLRQREGHILNIASFSGRCGQRGQASYAAAKAGLLGLTTSLAKEVGARNVRVNAILPGVLPTPMTAHLSEARRAEFAAANALGRLNSVEEVARCTVFLAGLRNVSGQLFQLDSRVAAWA